jgi:UDPglucose 6-dehydrogenase
MSNIAVVGAGYVGLVTAARLARWGNRVTCIEEDEGRLERLMSGRAPLFEPHLERLLREQVKAGRLSFAPDYASAIPQACLCFIAVDAPSGDDSTGTTTVIAAVDGLLPFARPGLVLVIKSGVPAGALSEIAARVRNSQAQDVEVVSNAELPRQSALFEESRRSGADFDRSLGRRYWPPSPARQSGGSTWVAAGASRLSASR